MTGKQLAKCGVGDPCSAIEAEVEREASKSYVWSDKFLRSSDRGMVKGYRLCYLNLCGLNSMPVVIDGVKTKWSWLSWPLPGHSWLTTCDVLTVFVFDDGSHCLSFQYAASRDGTRFDASVDWATALEVDPITKLVYFKFLEGEFTGELAAVFSSPEAFANKKLDPTFYGKAKRFDNMPEHLRDLAIACGVHNSRQHGRPRLSDVGAAGAAGGLMALQRGRGASGTATGTAALLLPEASVSVPVSPERALVATTRRTRGEQPMYSGAEADEVLEGVEKERERRRSKRRRH